MKSFALGILLLLLLWIIQLTNSTDQSWQEILEMEKMGSRRKNKPWTKKQLNAKEAGAIIQMTIEFIKDMDMKMRDVYRVEKIYIRTYDFGAGKMYQDLETYFDHMISLYRNTSKINKVYGPNTDLRSDIVGSLQFMLSDYCQFLSTMDNYKQRYNLFKVHGRTWEIRDRIQAALIQDNQYPYGYTTPYGWTGKPLPGYNDDGHSEK
ncbi:uncharacterized protein LOC133531983 [Cydia pomonella]|uniref:uncharacterized protein LOC133531983 n=1 Tax=Cydia pomonella TaxID=82600 RepID=UPI002ADDE6FC|nr:uncharacterized protein LOC133531983 [Cydia pomonella]